MPSVSFEFAKSMDKKQQERLLADLRSRSGVHTADRIDPESTNPVVTRMCFAEVDGGLPLDALRDYLSANPEITSVEIEPRRELVL